MHALQPRAVPRSLPPINSGLRSRNGLQMQTCALASVPDDANMTLEDRAKLFKILDVAEGMWSPTKTVVEHANPLCWKLVFDIEVAIALTNLSQLLVHFFDNITDIEVAWAPTLRLTVITTRGDRRVPTPVFKLETRLKSELGARLDKTDPRFVPDNWDALKPRLVDLSTLLYNQERGLDYRTIEVTPHPTHGTVTLHSMGMATANYAFLRALTRVANVCLLTATSSGDGPALNIRVAEGEPVPWREIGDQSGGAKDTDLDGGSGRTRSRGTDDTSDRPHKRARG